MPFDMDLFRLNLLETDPLVRDIWESKYKLIQPDGTSNEGSVEATRRRVVEAVYANDPAGFDDAWWAVKNGYLIPAGRVNAGAGTGRRVSLINCYVLPTIQDSMSGIQLSIAQGAFTLQQGGGIGSDFSTIRPAGALVRGVGSVASGVISFMDQQDGMCRTIMSAGTRRGAMMGTLRDDHPDLWNPRQYETHIDPNTSDTILTHPSFISAKRQKGRLTGFNVSVLVSDAFLKAVAQDAMWDLGFHVPRADGKHVDVYDKPFTHDVIEYDNTFNKIVIETVPGLISSYGHYDGDIKQVRKGDLLPWYVYQRIPARQIWEDIMRSTYKYAEPGVIYIDRVNQWNNLEYCEEIRTTNPCAEQPLPPNGCCCLGSVNLAFMVKDPFGLNAEFDYDLMKRVTAIGVRFLDNVLDVSNYPLTAQKHESMMKRRIGLGITGFADALVQLGKRYGSDDSIVTARMMGRTLKRESYRASVLLAKERGAFPMFDKDEFMRSPNVSSSRLDDQTRDMIVEHGIRNGVLNTIAPNGTISIYTGNLSSGHEPVFSFAPATRKVRQPDGTWTEYKSMPYSLNLWNAMFPSETPPSRLFVGAMDISVEDHVAIHAEWQSHIDASISKTINCPTEMTYEDFKGVYDEAYRLGCKGCTTYRYDPDSGRGSVLSVDKEPAHEAFEVMPAQRVVEARRYKLQWRAENWYITITRMGNTPFEVFITTRAAEHSEWVQAMSRLLTAVLRRGGDVRFLINELAEVHSAQGGYFIAEQQRFRPSVIAAIGGVIEEEFKTLGLAPVEVTHTGSDSCPECGATPLIHEQGCVRCLACDYNKCG